jgi:hypothetical protein
MCFTRKSWIQFLARTGYAPIASRSVYRFDSSQETAPQPAAQFIATHSLLPGSDYTIAPFEIHYSDRCLTLNFGFWA